MNLAFAPLFSGDINGLESLSKLESFLFNSDIEIDISDDL